MRVVRRLVCAHEYELKNTLYGDRINAANGKRFEHQCKKCGAWKYSDREKL